MGKKRQRTSFQLWTELANFASCVIKKSENNLILRFDCYFWTNSNMGRLDVGCTFTSLDSLVSLKYCFWYFHVNLNCFGYDGLGNINFMNSWFVIVNSCIFINLLIISRKRRFLTDWAINSLLHAFQYFQFPCSSS